jgi:hypothetical protein
MATRRPIPGGGGNQGPPPTGGLEQDLGTLIHDLLPHAGADQLKQDLTAVVTDIKTNNYGSDGNTPATVSSALAFIDNAQHTIIGHS